MSAQTLILSHFANLKLAGDRVVRDAVHSIQSVPPVELPRPARHARPTRRRRGRRYKHASSRRVNAMSDADLEAELAARRAARARERERYAKAMRSEKLALLESELLRLRSEISRIDRPTPLGGGTPPTARWEALPHDRRSSRNARSRPGAYPSSSPLGSPPLSSAPPPAAFPDRSAPGAPPAAPPMPPPPPPDLPAMDPEKQKREKLERQRRREAKRKEREAAKKPLTLADIIRGAGPNPAGRLKPSGSTPLPDVDEPKEDEKAAFANLKDTLKKVSPDAESNGQPSDTDPDKKDGDSSTDPQKQPSEDEKVKPSEEQAGSSSDSKSGKNEPSEQDKPKEPINTKMESETTTKPAAPPSSETDIDSARPAASSQDKSKSDEGFEKKDSPPAAAEAPSLPNGTQPHANGSTPTDSGADQPSTRPSEDAKDAVSALSALTAKLPKKSSPATSSNDMNPPDSGPSSKRLSLEEKRRLRRAARESAATKDD
ncbi:hypothetical protein FGB62_142g060 [Gracilaria domingensis]|nr:hypothetical protein FGB62_142g060 [Gracilaria domingensis]